MTAASALLGGTQPTTDLVEQAMRTALDKAGLDRADRVLLFLTRHFIHGAAAAVRAAARLGGTLEVAGCTAYGVLSETGWLLDQPGVAALVIGQAGAPGAGSDLRLSFSGHGTLPWTWQSGGPRVGLLDGDATVWSHGRVAVDACAEIDLPGMHARFARSSGLRLLARELAVEASAGYELRRVAGLSATESLRRCLPAGMRDAPPLHRLVALRDPQLPALAILASHADGSLTLSEPLAAGEQIAWAVRQPLSAERDMRETFTAAVDSAKAPDFALMFSCLGRGPLFYGDEDRDLAIFRQRLPGVPLAGAYGTGQIAPAAGSNRLFQNSVITVLCEATDV
jgi:hypothetical protein